MTRPYTFRFVDNIRNEQFLARLKRTAAEYIVDHERTIYFVSPEAESSIEKAAYAIRDRFVTPWQNICCPANTVAAYKKYMTAHDVEYLEEMSDGEIGFVVAQKYRPHTWRIEIASRKPVPRRKSIVTAK